VGAPKDARILKQSAHAGWLISAHVCELKSTIMQV